MYNSIRSTKQASYYDCYVLGSTYGHTVPNMFFSVIEFGGILEPPKGPQNCPEEGEWIEMTLAQQYGLFKAMGSLKFSSIDASLGLRLSWTNNLATLALISF